MNEAERIGDCLRALDAQRGGHPIRVLLLLNECIDGTGEVVRALRAAVFVPVDIVACDAPPARSGAGFARSLAMAQAARLAAGARVSVIRRR